MADCIIFIALEMKAFVYKHTTLIGETDLRPGESGMGGLYGNFRPNEYYYVQVQPLVRQLWAAGKSNRREWQALRLNVQLENGCFLAPAGGYAICDLEALPDDPVTINITGIHHFIIGDFFHSDPPQRFLLEPWNTITIEEKIAFEDELASEIGKYGDAAQQAAGNRHVLAGYECSAFARDVRSDDVLFAVYSRFDPSSRFAMVHLTWHAETDARWPSTDFFESFEAFKEQQMYPDASGYGA